MFPLLPFYFHFSKWNPYFFPTINTIIKRKVFGLFDVNTQTLLLFYNVTLFFIINQEDMICYVTAYTTKHTEKKVYKAAQSC